MDKKYYITTPIYYPNGKFHIGTAYTTILAETLKKYKAQRGYNTYLITGVDEHGQKIQDTAKENNMDPQEFVNMQAQKAKDLWELLDIKYDDFVRTTDDFHKTVVQKIFTHFVKKGDIYKGKYSGYYCKSCESYYTKTQLVDEKFCPDCGKEVKIMEEEAYFFNMKKYEKQLLQYYKDNPKFILPESRQNELINSFFKEGLEDLCVTRTTFDWGVKVPGDESHVIYVWLDALSNYITFAGYQTDEEKFNSLWPADLHIVGKDIIRFHAIYWPIFLMALDLPLPKQIYAHTWYVMKNGKISKSKGNVVYPDDLKQRFSNDVIKYILLRELPYNHDGLFTPEGFVERYNTDLCNDFSNLIHRTIGMINKYELNLTKEQLEQELKEYSKDNFDIELINNLLTAKNEFEENIDNIRVANSIEKLWEGISRINKYIDEKKPWELYKNNERTKLVGFIYYLYNALRIVNILVNPIITDSSKKMQEVLNFTDEEVKYINSNFDTILTNILPKENPEPLFNRMDEKNVEFIKSLMPDAN